MSRDARPTPFVSTVPVRRVPLSPLVASIRADYEARFGVHPEHPGGWYDDDDWSRLSFVTAALDRGGRFLDVGLGAGQFVNAIARTRWYDAVVGVDPTRFGKYIELEPGIERHDVSVTELPFDDRSFDVVTCMEVLEHLPEGLLEPALAELRRVCRGQLVMTVPFEEPEPLSPTHQRRFTAGDLGDVFPTATAVLLDRPGMPWALLEERPAGPAAGPPAIGLRLVALEQALEARPRVLAVTRGATARVETARRTIARSAAGPTLKRLLRTLRRAR